MNGTGNEEASVGTTAAESCRLTRSLTIAIAREKRIDNGTHVGSMHGMEKACPSGLLLMLTVCQMYRGTREGSHMGGTQLANYQTVVGHDAAQQSFWLERK